MTRPVRCACWQLLVLIAPLLALLPDGVHGQDFKVATRLLQRNADGARWTEVGQSVTLFHAGKVYDYMQQIGEVIVLEPTESQFVILCVNGNNLATTLNFAELQQFLKVAESEMQGHLRQLADEGEASAKRRQAIEFQLNPRFQESHDPAGKTLSFISPLLRYDVETAAIDRPQVAQQYLQYADWAARMNYVLHARSLYPSVRLAVNRSLAERERIPTEVRLLLEGDVPLHLKAEHKYDWTLGSIDKSIILKCEKLRTDEATRWVNFREYQRTLTAQK